MLNQRDLTLRMLRGAQSWPLGGILPLWRLAGALREHGYVMRNGEGAGLTVFLEDSTTRERTYASHEDIVNAGWRVD